MQPEKIFYEPAALSYALGEELRQKYADVPWVEIESHNNIPELRQNPNSAFPRMKRYFIVGVRKSLAYVPNHKTSDFLVPYTSSGCSAMCLYCYLVCNYNKCSYLRLFVNREKMMDKLLKTAASAERDLTFEIGSNSDLILENTVTNNLPWTIERFAAAEKGFLTFPTKFDFVEPLLPLDHKGRCIVRMSVNPQSVIKRVELLTAPLEKRVSALNRLCEAGYRVGLLIAPVVLMEGWCKDYGELVDVLSDTLTEKTRRSVQIEIIFMTYSFVHRAINNEAFPNAVELYSNEAMTGRGRGKYCYREGLRAEAEAFLRLKLAEKLPDVPIAYIV